MPRLLTIAIAAAALATPAFAQPTSQRQGHAPPAPAGPKPKNLSFKEQQELAGMELAIKQAETEVQKASARMGDTAVMADRRKFTEVCREHAKAQEESTKLYERWQQLEARK